MKLTSVSKCVQEFIDDAQFKRARLLDQKVIDTAVG